MYPDYVQALLTPSKYNHKVDEVHFEQTHLSYVFIAGDYVYKIKKPVSFDFVDQTELQQRYKFCLEEVKQNSILAPDVYLGIVPITVDSDGQIYINDNSKKNEIIEYAVKMKKLQVKDNLEFLIKNKVETIDIAEIVVNKIFIFHQQANIFNAGLKHGGWKSEKTWCDDELLQQKIHIGHSLEKNDARLIAAYISKVLEKYKLIFDNRYTEQQIIFGHGDLQLKHFYLNQTDKNDLNIVDCIEFSDAFHFKYVDKGYDLSFLTMGLDLHGNNILADEICGRYLSLVGDKYLSLLHPYHKFLRALIRGKVEGLTALSDTTDDQIKKKSFENSKMFFKLATKYSKISQDPCIVVVAGLSGSGKSIISGAIACRIGAVYLSSDVIRKEMFGISKYDNISSSQADEIYSNQNHVAVYNEIRQQAKKYIDSGFSVVIDAAHLKVTEREDIRNLCSSLHLPLEFIWLNTSEEILKNRINERSTKEYIISDAKLEVHNLQLNTYDKIAQDEEIVVIDNSTSFDSAFKKLINSSKVLHDRLIC